MADISKRAPGCDDDRESGERGERGKRGKRGHRGHEGPIGPTGPAGPQVPTPPFVDEDVFIFVRQNGSDETGDGSLAKPFRTIQWAIRQVPNVIPPETIYRIDATGLGLEIFPTNYQFPVFVGAEGLGAIDFAQPTFHYYTSVNIQAEPQLATGVTGITTIPPGAIVSVPKPSTGLLRIQFLGAGWTPGQLKGKFLIGAGGPLESSVIWDNGVDTIDITSSSTPTFPAMIAENSCEIRAPRDSSDIHLAAINILNSQLGLLGIKVTSIPDTFLGPPFFFPAWALQVGGNQPPVPLQLCDINNYGGTENSAWVRVRQCYLSEQVFQSSPVLITQSYLDRSAEPIPGFRKTIWNQRGTNNLIRQSVLENTVQVRFIDTFDDFQTDPCLSLILNQVQILNTVPDLFPDPTAGSNGIKWFGVSLQLLGVDISRTVGPAVGNAIEVAGNHANIKLRSVTGSGYAVGCLAEDGANVFIDDQGGPPTTVTGAAGDVSVGSLGVQPWPALYPADNYLDTAPPPSSAQLVRVWRKS